MCSPPLLCAGGLMCAKPLGGLVEIYRALYLRSVAIYLRPILEERPCGVRTSLTLAPAAAPVAGRVGDSRDSESRGGARPAARAVGAIGAAERPGCSSKAISSTSSCDSSRKSLGTAT